MEELERPQIQQKLANIRATLQHLNSSFTEDDRSEANVSTPSSASSHYKVYSTPSDRHSRDWTSYDSYKPVGDPDISLFKSKLFELQISEENLNKRLKEKESEINNLRTSHYELQRQFGLMKENFEKKVRKLKDDKKSLVNSEEDAKKALREMKEKEEELYIEVQELKENNGFVEEEKNYLQNELKDSIDIIERLKKTIKAKEETILNLYQSRSDIEKELLSKVQSPIKEELKSNMKRLKIPDRSEFSPVQPEFNFTDRNEISYKTICTEAMKIAGVTSAQELYSRLLHLRQYHSKYKKSRKLVDKISDMIIQCSPTGVFNKKPNTHQIWKWLTGFLEEYSKLVQATQGKQEKKG